MNYPFLSKNLGHLNPEEIKKNLIFLQDKFDVWDDWQLLAVNSEQVRGFINEKLSHLKIFKNQIFVSRGTKSNFHIDRYHVHHLLHRILIPLSENFHYEWMLNEVLHTYSPKSGEVILFNNMVPHRFVSDNNELRDVIYFDLYDPLVEDLISNIKGNYSYENGQLDKKYSGK